MINLLQRVGIDSLPESISQAQPKNYAPATVTDNMVLVNELLWWNMENGRGGVIIIAQL
ncbi:MAG: hypothetical protein HKP41_00285 [Desulfobacterales bacterium]|nr:hypothetical protein [Desulfobacterales bacterium]